MRSRLLAGAMAGVIAGVPFGIAMQIIGAGRQVPSGVRPASAGG
jgi:hypothetical protein